MLCLPALFLSFTIISTIFLSKEVTPHSVDKGTLPLKQTYREILDPSRDLVLGWRVDSSRRTITFQVEFRTKDRYVVLGLAVRERLPIIDILVIGEGHGSAYVLDMHAYDNSTIRTDVSQHWHLMGTSTTHTAKGKITSVRIQRDLDTCDDEDVVIKELINVSWDYSSKAPFLPPPTFKSRGSKPIFFLDPMTLPISVNVNQVRDSARVWRLRRHYRIPSRQTSYFCSLHKFEPSLTKQHHIVGFTAYFGNEVARRHVHHQFVYRCSLPSYMDPVTVFGPFANRPGEECYLNANTQLPSGYCRELVHIWAVGGEPVMLPETMGIPIGDTTNEYFLFEAHYDNPERRTDLEVTNGVDIFYSPKLRPNEGSIIIAGSGVLGPFVVPPNAPEFKVVGHCGSLCTMKMLSSLSSPANIVGVSLHAHIAARRMRLKHYRGFTELPWIQDDQDYHYDYQQIRFHPEPVPFLPSDHLTTQCTYSTKERNGSALATGYSTLDEMCMAFLFIDKRLPYMFCASEYPVVKTMNNFGIKNMTWDIERAERVVTAAANPNFVGLTLSEVVVAQGDWTSQKVAQLEKKQMYSSHVQNCVNTRFVGEILGAISSPAMAPIRNLIAPKISITLNTMQAPASNLIPVKFPPVTVPYVPPTCPI